MNKNSNVLNFAIIILLFIFNVLLISTFGLLFKFPINKWGFIFSIIFTVFEIIYILKKQNSTYKSIIINIILFILIVSSSILIAGNIADTSYDGNTYHKAAIGQLKNGWNPFYESLGNFHLADDGATQIQSSEAIWTDHYAKGIWIFAANVYSLTNNIESGKCISILTAILTFLFGYTALSNKIQKNYSALLSLLITLNPVFLSQCMTYYNDALMGNFILILIFIFTLIIDDSNEKPNVKYYISLCLTLVIVLNIKFTGFIYAGIYSIFYYVYILLNKKTRKKHLLILTITGIISVIVGACIIGYSTYIKNTIDYKNPFYPLMGEGKVDIMTNNTPSGLLEMNRFKRFIVAILSRTYNTPNTGVKLYELKLPLTFYPDELYYSIVTDTRIGGYGVLFSGILLYSFIAGLFAIIMSRTKKVPAINIVKYLLPIAATVFLVLILDECWWARYLPQLYLLPFLVLLMLENLNKIKFVRYVKYFILFFIIVNIYLHSQQIVAGYVNNYSNYKNIVNKIRNTNEQIYVDIGEFTGAIFNVSDNTKKYEVIHDNIELKGYTKYHLLNEDINLYIKE